jgi:hypothetical protein
MVPRPGDGGVAHRSSAMMSISFPSISKSVEEVVNYYCDDDDS